MKPYSDLELILTEHTYHNGTFWDRYSPKFVPCITEETEDWLLYRMWQEGTPRYDLDAALVETTDDSRGTRYIVCTYKAGEWKRYNTGTKVERYNVTRWQEIYL